MKFTVSTDTLGKAVPQAREAAAPSSSTFPWSTCIHLTALAEGQLRLQATDAAIALSVWIGAEVHEPGSMLINAATFGELIKTFPPGVQLQCELAAATQTLKITGLQAGFKTQLKGMAANDFPSVPTLTTEGALAIQGSQLISMFQAVRQAVATDQARPLLTAVHFKLASNQLLIETADGFRMHRAAVGYASPKQVDIAIPGSAIDAMLKAVDPAELVYVKFMEREGRIARVAFIQDTLQLICNSMEGSYPDISAIIPKSSPVTVTVVSSVLLACLRRADQMADGTHLVRLNIKPGTATVPGRIEVSTREAETGDHLETLSATVSGPIDISLNLRYLQELVRAADTPTVKLEMQTNTSPLMVTTTSFTGVCMPMHVGTGVIKAQ